MRCVAHCFSLDGNPARERAFHLEKTAEQYRLYHQASLSHYAPRLSLSTEIRMRKFLALHRLEAHGSLE